MSRERRLVQAAEDPDQGQDRQGNSKQPEQKIASHQVLLSPRFDAKGTHTGRRKFHRIVKKPKGTKMSKPALRFGAGFSKRAFEENTLEGN